MIFKTFDSKIDKWTSKIGIFGKSFNELVTAVNDAFKSVIDNIDNFDENVGFWESLKNNLFSNNDANKDWIKNSIGEIISQENIDSYIKELDLDTAKEKIADIFSSGSKQWEGSPSELCKFLGLSLKPNVLTLKLNVNAGRLVREYGIYYDRKRCHGGRKVLLWTDKEEKA